MNDDDAGEDALSRIDLHVWRVPPPAPMNRAEILERTLSPAVPPRRPRRTWVLAAFAIANVALAALLVIVLSRRPAETIVSVRPAGGGTLDAQTQEILRRLQQEQLELESKLAEVQQLRALVEQLSDKVRQCEATVDKTVDKRDRPAPRPTPTHDVPPPAPPVDLTSCDEVSCILSNYEGACCAALRLAPPPPVDRSLPESLDRAMISAAMSGIRAQVSQCHSPEKGLVKVRVRVGANGRVENVVITSTPDPVLARCVASAVQKARFGATQRGGSFSYPFVF